MRAWVIDQFAGIEKARLTDVPAPVAGPGQVVLALHYAALNPADYYLAEGMYPARPPLPHILGRDGVGTVTAVGDGVTDCKAGDVRAILRGEAGVTQPGTFAEQVAVPADRLVPVPQGWGEQQTAAAPLVYLTAWQAITQWGELPSSCVTLVTGASGGVGVATVQLAAKLGHTVVGLSRSETKRKHLHQLGAAVTFDTSTPWLKSFKSHFGGFGKVDLAIDNIGGEMFNDLLKTLSHNGRISCVGRLAGPVPQFNTAELFFRRIKIGGIYVGDYDAARAQTAWGNVLNTLGDTRPLIDGEFAFDQLHAAFTRLRAGPLGKVVLRIR